MTTRYTGRVELSADALRLLLQCAGQTLNAYSEDEYGRHLHAAVREGVNALETPTRTHGESRIDADLIDTIQGIFEDAYGYVGDVDDGELCERIGRASYMLAACRETPEHIHRRSAPSGDGVILSIL